MYNNKNMNIKNNIKCFTRHLVKVGVVNFKWKNLIYQFFFIFVLQKLHFNLQF